MSATEGWVGIESDQSTLVQQLACKCSDPPSPCEPTSEPEQIESGAVHCTYQCGECGRMFLLATLIADYRTGEGPSDAR